MDKPPKKLTRMAILDAQQTITQLDAHIKDYLLKLQDAEAAIISVDEDIASGKHRCFHYRPNPLFHHLNPYAPYSKATIAYNVEAYQDDGIAITFTENPWVKLTVPYTPSKQAFKAHVTTLFAKERSDMEHCRNVKIKAIKEEEAEDKKDKEIRGPHKQDKYTYRWTDCKDCKGSGRTYVGTGHWEVDPFDYHDHQRQREVTKAIPCPRCHMAQGLLIYSKDDEPEKEVPCSRWAFEHNDSLFELILAANSRRTQ